MSKVYDKLDVVLDNKGKPVGCMVIISDGKAFTQLTDPKLAKLWVSSLLKTEEKVIYLPDKNGFVVYYSNKSREEITKKLRAELAKIGAKEK